MDYFKIESQTNSSKNSRKLDLLNLEFVDHLNTNIISNQNYNLTCRVSNTVQHSLHTENQHLNGITDLILNLGINLQKQITIINSSLQKIQTTLDKKKESLHTLSDNLTYIKEQNNQILVELRQVHTKEQHVTTQKDIDKISEALNKLNISDIRIEKTPKPYNHWQPRR